MTNLCLSCSRYVICISLTYIVRGIDFLPSFLLIAAWKIIKAWLPAGAVKKIKFVNKNTIDEFVPYDQKFVHWGGEDDWAYEFVGEYNCSVYFEETS